MSSPDSVLLVAASVVTRDIRMELAPVTDAGAVAWTRGGIIAFAALAVPIALNPPGDIVEIPLFSGSLRAVYFASAVPSGPHWRRGSTTAALAGGAVGITVPLVWLASDWQVRLHEVFPVLAASALVHVTLAFVTAGGGFARRRFLCAGRCGHGTFGCGTGAVKSAEGWREDQAHQRACE